ncbi:DUF885 domain-containing protein [Candidatus Viadribacter manganicus]|uniref:DUF885 domain-containing protein n=1 Tax=Candidatus Viadribacter manganicus TaxID=1759059 RepID=A0A1B1ANN0_9PROT|nr:DUF885 domain-containing protein [Candidatus Viadribacter manganicus]ANP48130.1 hypothetical protein ATE48_16730 [Candidatus Viadribacter manganicus]
MNKFIALAAAALLTLAGCNQSANWDQFQNAFIERAFEIDPTFGASQGRHEFDGRLPDWSEGGLTGAKTFLRDTITQAEAMSGLNEEQAFQRDYLVAVARGQLFWLETADQPHANPAYYMGALSPSMYVARPYAAADVRLRAYIRYLQAVPNAAQQIRANLRTPMPLTFVNYGRSSFGGLADYYQGDGKAAFAEVTDAALQTQLTEASNAASVAMRELSDWVEAQRPNATSDFALGAERFSQMLRDTEMVDLPLEEIERIGREDLARNQAAMREACAQFAPGVTISQCMSRMGEHKPEGGSVEGARAQLAGLRQFIADNNLVSIPGTEEAQVAEAPPFRRQNFAYIDIPGPYETNLPSVYYIAPPDPSWPAQVQHDFVPGRAELLFVSAHEVWPGHFLNFLHANRSRNQFGRVFVGYAYAEGWAHYTEEMMWDAGLGNGDPETHVGQISNALRRDCRFLSAILMHTGRMTVDQSREMFVNECYQDEGNARQQAARGTYDPAYLNYTLGKLLIRRLREDWTATRGGREGWHDFHDEFLSYGGPPIPLVRQQMMGGEAQAVF